MSRVSSWSLSFASGCRLMRRAIWAAFPVASLLPRRPAKVSRPYRTNRPRMPAPVFQGQLRGEARTMTDTHTRMVVRHTGHGGTTGRSSVSVVTVIAPGWTGVRRSAGGGRAGTNRHTCRGISIPPRSGRTHPDGMGRFSSRTKGSIPTSWGAVQCTGSEWWSFQPSENDRPFGLRSG